VKKHKQEDIKTKGACCFNHIVGLPRKDGIEKPLFDYEWLLYRRFSKKGYLNSNPKFHSDDPNNIAYTFKEKHLWVKKATGLGVTEFFLRSWPGFV